MKPLRYTEGQIILMLKQAEQGTPVSELCNRMGVSDTTFYTWRKKYGGLGQSDHKRLKELEKENSRLKHLVADLSLEKALLEDVLAQKNLQTNSSPRIYPAPRRWVWIPV